MEVFSILCIFVASAFLLLLLYFAKSDADLTLRFVEMFGTPTSSLSGKVVWITGASSGIGEHLAYKLSAVGCKLVLSARREGELQRVRDRCLLQGGSLEKDVLVLPLDMLEYNTHSSAVRRVLTYFGKIDILVNNAGRSQRAIWSRTPLEIDRQVLELNVLGVLSLSKAVLPHFLEQKSGHFVITGSLSGKFGVAGLGSYSGSKHALHGWFESLRQEEYCNNIHVTMICPGSVYSNSLDAAFTDTPGKSLGQVSKIGENRLATSRCAELIAVSIANKLDEAWMSLQPDLSYVYLYQYLPTISRKIAVRIGEKRKNKILHGRTDLH